MSQNEGEGSKSAARNYNKGAEEFAKSGKVQEQAEAAKQAVEGSEGEKLRQAEKEGKSHAKGEDPKVRRGG